MTETDIFNYIKSAYVPNVKYNSYTIEGWTVFINAQYALDYPTTSQYVLDEIKYQLRKISLVVPAVALAKIRQVKIWVDECEGVPNCTAYNPSLDWIVQNLKDPGKAKSVEIGNTRNFLSWTIQQPWMLMHEMSHAYHDQFLPNGFQNPAILTVFNATMASKIYDSVLQIEGIMGKSYAETNAMEYFASMSAAYFGNNNFYPFNRAELQQYDPATYTLIGSMWGL